MHNNITILKCTPLVSIENTLYKYNNIQQPKLSHEEYIQDKPAYIFQY